MVTPATTLAGVTDLGDWLNEVIAPDSADAKRAVLCLRLASALVRNETGRTSSTPTAHARRPGARRRPARDAVLRRPGL